MLDVVTNNFVNKTPSGSFFRKNLGKVAHLLGKILKKWLIF